MHYGVTVYNYLFPINFCQSLQDFLMNSVIKRNTGVNTGVPVLPFLNIEIPVLPNIIGTEGPSSKLKSFGRMKQHLPKHQQK